MKTSRRTAALMAALLMAATIVAEPASGLPSGGRLTETDPGGSYISGEPDTPGASYVIKVSTIGFGAMRCVVLLNMSVGYFQLAVLPTSTFETTQAARNDRSED